MKLLKNFVENLNKKNQGKLKAFSEEDWFYKKRMKINKNASYSFDFNAHVILSKVEIVC